jgi:lysophospholipase L1-like esterase
VKTINGWIADLWSWRGGWLASAISWGMFLVALCYFTVVGLLLWKGYVWAYIFYAERPFAHLFGGLAFLFGWHYVRRGYKNDAAAWRALGGRCLLLTVAVLLSAAIGEVGLRLILMRQQQAQSLTRLQEMVLRNQPRPVRSLHPMSFIIQPSADKNLVFELQPNLNTNFGHRLVRTSRQGFREDRDYPVERLPNSVRIIGLGDSGMFGWSIEQGGNYMDVLEQRLQQRDDGVLYEVINMAVPGYNTALEIEMLRSKGLAFRPDIVVVGWCENDFQLPYFLLERENFMRRDYSYLYAFIFNRTNLAEIVMGERVKDMRAFDEDALAPGLKTGAQVTGVERALNTLKSMAAGHGFRALVFGPMGDDILAICRRVDVPYYNTRERIPRDRYPAEWAVHFMHPSPEGHRALAEHLEEALEERDWFQPNKENRTSNVQHSTSNVE